MIDACLEFEKQRAGGLFPKFVLKVVLVGEILMFAEEGIDGLAEVFHRADGSVKADGSAVAGEVVQFFSRALISFEDFVEGDIGAGLRTQLGEARRTTLTARLANTTGVISDLMAGESFIGKASELLMTYPGLPYRKFARRFVGEVGNVQLADDYAELALRSA